jgi:hypothetical protein
MNTLTNDIIREHDGKEHIRGTRDCNLLFFKINEPDMFDALYQQYDGIIKGVKAGKRIFGCSSLRNFLKKNNYTEVPANFQREGDIIAFKKGHNTYISLGNKWFGVQINEKFGVVNRYHYTNDQYLVFRKE